MNIYEIKLTISGYIEPFVLIIVDKEIDKAKSAAINHVLDEYTRCMSDIQIDSIITLYRNVIYNKE